MAFLANGGFARWVARLARLACFFALLSGGFAFETASQSQQQLFESGFLSEEGQASGFQGNSVKGFRNRGRVLRSANAKFDEISKAVRLPPTEMNKAMRETFLYYHNLARRDAYRYFPLRWNDSLASLAQDWATKMAKLSCPLPPVQNKFGSQITFRPVDFGENQFYTWYMNGYDIYNATAINAYWIKQQYSYNYYYNRCYKNKFCGNYLQIVWKPAKSFGCGIHECPLTYASGWTFKMVVCNYDDQFYYDTPPY